MGLQRLSIHILHRNMTEHFSIVRGQDDTFYGAAIYASYTDKMGYAGDRATFHVTASSREELESGGGSFTTAYSAEQRILDVMDGSYSRQSERGGFKIMGLGMGGSFDITSPGNADRLIDLADMLKAMPNNSMSGALLGRLRRMTDSPDLLAAITVVQTVAKQTKFVKPAIGAARKINERLRPSDVNRPDTVRQCGACNRFFDGNNREIEDTSGMDGVVKPINSEDHINQ